MKRLGHIFTTVIAIYATNSHAALHYRGEGMVYDDILDVTWLQDANYARTSGYAEENQQYDDSTYPENIQSNGTMGSWAAANWVEDLIYGGFNDWRLPSILPESITNSDSCYGDWNGLKSGDGLCTGKIATGELGFMYYKNLGNEVGSESLNTSFMDFDSGLSYDFLNVGYQYFYNELVLTDDGDQSDGIYSFRFDTGDQRTAHVESSLYAWAVRDGDVAIMSTPEINSTGFPLLISMLGGLLLIMRERRPISLS